MKLRLKKNYILLFLLTIIIEFAILYTEGFIRHSIGDFLIVIAIYCLLLSFVQIKPYNAAIIVLLFSFLIECLQLTNFLHFLNLENSAIAKTIFGNTFSKQDLIAYTLGIILVLLLEKLSK